MAVAVIVTDPISVLLVVGMVLSAGAGIALATMRPDRYRAQQRADQRAGQRVKQQRPQGTVEIVSPASILARAEAAAREQSSKSRLAIGPGTVHARPGSPVAATGHTQSTRDDSQADRAERRAEATKLAIHIAQHDPQRMAEVITEWIRTSDSDQPFDRP